MGNSHGSNTATAERLARVSSARPAHDMVSSDWQTRYDEYQAPTIARYAAEHGQTPAAYEASVTRQLRRWLSGTQVYTRRSSATAERIIAEGAFKTLHDTGRSAGEADVGGRQRFETRVFGTTGAIYGYAARPDESGQHATSYGDAIFELKPSKLGETTVTFGDSYESTIAGAYSRAAVSPTPFTTPTYRSWMFNSGVGWTHEPASYGSLGAYSRTGEYVEAQIHGGLTMGDIASVRFSGAPPSSATLATLRASHIPVYLGASASPVPS